MADVAIPAIVVTNILGVALLGALVAKSRGEQHHSSSGSSSGAVFNMMRAPADEAAAPAKPIVAAAAPSKKSNAPAKNNAAAAKQSNSRQAAARKSTSSTIKPLSYAQPSTGVSSTPLPAQPPPGVSSAPVPVPAQPPPGVSSAPGKSDPVADAVAFLKRWVAAVDSPGTADQVRAEFPDLPQLSANGLTSPIDPALGLAPALTQHAAVALGVKDDPSKAARRTKDLATRELQIIVASAAAKLPPPSLKRAHEAFLADGDTPKVVADAGNDAFVEALTGARAAASCAVALAQSRMRPDGLAPLFANPAKNGAELKHAADALRAALVFALGAGALDDAGNKASAASSWWGALASRVSGASAAPSSAARMPALQHLLLLARYCVIKAAAAPAGSSAAATDKETAEILDGVEAFLQDRATRPHSDDPEPAVDIAELGWFAVTLLAVVCSRLPTLIDVLDAGAGTARSASGAGASSGSPAAASATGSPGAGTASGNPAAAAATGSPGAGTALGNPAAAAATGSPGAGTASGNPAAAGAAKSSPGAAPSLGKHAAATATATAISSAEPSSGVADPYEHIKLVVRECMAGTTVSTVAIDPAARGNLDASMAVTFDLKTDKGTAFFEPPPPSLRFSVPELISYLNEQTGIPDNMKSLAVQLPLIQCLHNKLKNGDIDVNDLNTAIYAGAFAAVNSIAAITPVLPSTADDAERDELRKIPGQAALWEKWLPNLPEHFVNALSDIATSHNNAYDAATKSDPLWVVARGNANRVIEQAEN